MGTQGVAKLPATVKIGTQTWEIVERTKNFDGMLDEGNYGYTLSRENLIVLDGTAAPSRKRQTLLHELLHAVKFSFGNPVTPKKTDEADVWEHYFIAMYEEGILLVLRENPEVLDYLLAVD
jgi:hypothetical protein